MVAKPLSDADYRRAEFELAQNDPVIARIIEQVGSCRLADGRPRDPFTFLTRALVFQQLSTKAASTIYGRFLALMPDRTIAAPEATAALTDEAMRSAGVSRQKAMYLRDLAEKVRSGAVALHSFETMTDEEVVASLTRVKGIGRWSAEMFLMFHLHRPDVLPVGDLGIGNAIHRAYRLRARPTAARMTRIAQKWRPWRTVACWYLWRSLELDPDL